MSYDAPFADASLDAMACPSPSLLCGATCVDPHTDVHHCGGCAIDCATLTHIEGSSASCQGGICQFTCAPGYANCADAGGGCGTSLSSNQTCGACGTSCSGDTPACSPLLADGGGDAAPGDGGVGCTPGCTPATDVRCNGACVDEQTDLSNCGACGVACDGQCALGRCLLALADALPGSFLCSDVAVDSSNVYWVDSENAAIYHVPTSGGPVTTSHLPPMGQYVSNVAIGVNGVYASNGTSILMAPLDGGPGVTTFSGADGLGDLTTDANRLYWTNLQLGEVFALSFDGGAVATFASNQYLPFTVAVSPSALFWTSTGPDAGVASAGLDGGAVTLEPWGHAQQVIWAGDSLYLSTFSSIVRIPGGTGTPVPLVSGGKIHSMTSDGSNVYWSEVDSESIMRVSVQGGTPITLVTEQSSDCGFAVDATSLYWIGNGGLLKLTPK